MFWIFQSCLDLYLKKRFFFLRPFGIPVIVYDARIYTVPNECCMYIGRSDT